MFGTKRNPMNDLEQLFNQFGVQSELEWNHEGTFPVDIVDDDDHLYISADLPGYSKENINLTVDDRMLMITADREEIQEIDDDEQYIMNERRSTVSRRVRLPDLVDIESSEAEYNNGVLTVTFDKITAEESQSSIQIN